MKKCSQTKPASKPKKAIAKKPKARKPSTKEKNESAKEYIADLIVKNITEMEVLKAKTAEMNEELKRLQDVVRHISEIILANFHVIGGSWVMDFQRFWTENCQFQKHSKLPGLPGYFIFLFHDFFLNKPSLAVSGVTGFRSVVLKHGRSFNCSLKKFH